MSIFNQPSKSLYNQAVTPKEIATSKIIAKSVIPQDGHVTIIAAFEKSTQYTFYITFTAKSPRTPRRLWKLLSARSARGFQGVQMSIEEISAQIAAGRQVVTRFPIGKKKFAERLDHINNPYKYITTTPQERLPAGASVEKVNDKLRAKLKGSF